MIRFIAEHRSVFGVEPICRVLEIAPSTWYAARSRSPSARAIRDTELRVDILRVHAESHGLYGVRKTWRQLLREGIVVGRDRVARLMRDQGLRGVVRGRSVRTTRPAPDLEPPADLVDRDFTADAPDRLWVADLTYVPIATGFCYASFVTDVFSRRIVGWRVSSSLHTDLPLDALEMAVFGRGDRDLAGLIHHSDRGSQYLSIRYTGRLAEEGAIPSVGSRGDSYDNALAESVNGLYKTELIGRQPSWRTTAEVEAATSRWVHWWNTRRLHSACHYLSPAEYEAAYWASHQVARAA